LLGLLRSFRPVLGASLHAPLDADCVERAPDNVVTHTREILDTAPTNEHEGVFLQVVADARNVGGHLDPVREPYARHLSERGIGLLWRLREHPDAHAALLRAVLKSRTLGLADDLL